MPPCALIASHNNWKCSQRSSKEYFSNNCRLPMSMNRQVRCWLRKGIGCTESDFGGPRTANRGVVGLINDLRRNTFGSGQPTDQLDASLRPDIEIRQSSLFFGNTKQPNHIRGWPISDRWSLLTNATVPENAVAWEQSPWYAWSRGF